jgi:hypothetical protein
VLLGKTLTGVAKTALYVYATEDTAPEYFEDMEFRQENLVRDKRRNPSTH